MKNKLLILLLGFGLTGFANVLPSASVTDLRDWNQYRRIERGVNMGLLSYREEGILLQQQENIENYIYRAMQYGITPRENRNIQNMRIEADLLIEEFSDNFEYRIPRTALRFNYGLIPRYYTYTPYRSNHGHHHHNNGYRNYNDDHNNYRGRNDNHGRNDYNNRHDNGARRDRGYGNRDNNDNRNDREEVRGNSNRNDNNKNDSRRNNGNRTLPKNVDVTQIMY